MNRTFKQCQISSGERTERTERTNNKKETTRDRHLLERKSRTNQNRIDDIPFPQTQPRAHYAHNPITRFVPKCATQSIGKIPAASERPHPYDCWKASESCDEGRSVKCTLELARIRIAIRRVRAAFGRDTITKGSRCDLKNCTKALSHSEDSCPISELFTSCDAFYQRKSKRVQITSLNTALA